ncbi:AMP-binding protein [Candidatus Bipolaricaulota bacterium]|nr:AMP-binding protein [Candidatus Bipolaricaulota bacterium]
MKKGDPVLHIFPRLPEAFIAQIGTFKAGGVAVPCTEMLRAKDIIYRVEVSGARVVVAHTSTADEVEEVRGYPSSSGVSAQDGFPCTRNAVRLS